MRKVTLKQAKHIGKRLKLNFEIIDLKEFRYGMEVELEHGKRFGAITNVTNDDLYLTGKIVLAHLVEFPDYYARLKKMESVAERYWAKRKRPNIFLK